MADKSPAQVLKSIDDRLKAVQFAAILFITITLAQCLLQIIAIVTFGGSVMTIMKAAQEYSKLQQSNPISTPYQYP